MQNSSWQQAIGLVSSIALPFFNIPLMIHLVRRRSSDDLSMTWLIGVFFCLVGMFPAGLRSPDLIFKIFSIINLTFFSGVTFLGIRFRFKK